MEVTQPESSLAEDRSEKTAKALRALREKLGVRTDDERRSASEVQADIIARIFQITEEMASEQASEAQEAAQSTGKKLASLEATLVEREELVSQLQTQLSELKHDRSRLQDELHQERASAEQLRRAPCNECLELREKLGAVEDRAVAAETSASQLQEDAAEAARKIAELQSWRETAATQDEQAAKLRAEATQAEQRCGELSEALANLSDERDSLAEELATVRSDLEQQMFDSASSETRLQAELEEATEKFSAEQLRMVSIEQERDSLAEELAEASASIARLTDDTAGWETRFQSAVSAEHDKLLEAQQEIENLRQDRESLTQELSSIQAKVTQLQDQKNSEYERLTNELEESKHLAAKTQAEFEKLTSEHDKLSAKLDSLHEELTAQQAGSERDVAEREKELHSVREQLSQLVQEKQQLETSRDKLFHQLEEAHTQNEQTAARLQDAENQLGALPDQHQHSEELKKSQRKFELAQADVQKLKRENAELQEELARRPGENDQESPELISLRVERDALAARVAELEELPAQTVDEDAQQNMADLQRRFEMAVDDLRQVKYEKAQLEEKLTQASVGKVPAMDSGAMDWQSQKARLLASLESDGDEEGDEGTAPERAQEKINIQGTIEITDQIVANKDREIAELQAQLATIAEEKPQDQDIGAEICDKDEMIQAERARLKQLQTEWREKLRGAELEMSTQRATLARKEAELKELLAAAQEAANDAALSNGDKPRRRWLSALGLGEDEPKES